MSAIIGAPLGDMGNEFTVVGNSTGAAQTMHMIGYGVSVEHNVAGLSQPELQPAPSASPNLTV